MKRNCKKGLTLVLMLALLLGNLCLAPKEAQAASQNEAVNWANAQINKSLDYDGVCGCQCVDLIKYYYAYFGYANYAMGNANAYISNNLPPGWTRVYSNYQPGDIAVWKTNHSCSTCGTTSLGHVGIITSADSVGFNAVNQNFSNQSFCSRNWFYCSALACAIRPSYSGGTTVAPSPSVTFADFNQNGVWDTNAEMYIKVMNPNRGKVSAVGCYLYNANGGLIKSYSESCNYTTSYVNYNCNINNDMKYSLTPGTSYQFELYAIVDGKEYKDTRRSFKTTGYSDIEKPVISDAVIYDVTETGYKVKCKATDNVGVVRVQFPSWTSAKGQDDIISDWVTNSRASGTLSNGYWIYEVKNSEHNNELGEYITHIYAFDKAGNSTCVAMPATVLKKTVAPPTQAPPVQEDQDGNNLAAVAEREYNSYHGQSYNYQYGSSPWCCNFVSWCARQAGISTDVIINTATVQTMYDSLVNKCGATLVSSPQRGDLVFYKYTDYDSEKFHHIGIMTSATETVQGNVNSSWWKGNPNALNNIKEMVYVRPAYNGEYVAPNSPYFNDYNLNKTEDNNAEVYIKVQNPNREGVTAVGCDLYDDNGSLLKSYSESCSYTSSYVNYTCNFASDMGYTLKAGTRYKFVLYAIVGGKRINDKVRSFTTTGVKEKNSSDLDEDTSESSPEDDKTRDINDDSNSSSTSPDTETLKKPTKITGLSLYSRSKKIFASWRFRSSLNRTGYQIQYAMNKSFSKGKKTKNLGYYKSYVVLKNLKKGKNYYVRVRGVNKVGSKIKYGEWSKSKKVKVRK